MREILFRGKANGGCCWVYGHYAVLNDGYRPDWKRHYLLSGELRYNDQYGKEDIRKVEIDPKTLGQYTGLKDKNGKRIYEGDIVECWSEGVNAKGTVQQRKDGMWIIYPAWQKVIMWSLCPDEHCNTTVEVIGNIHDNPELIGGVNDENA